MAYPVRILLLVVLVTHLVCEHCIDCGPEGKAETENSLKNRVRYDKRNDINRTPVCGRRPVTKTNLKRQVNFSGDNFDFDIDEDPDVDKILGGNYATYGEFPWMANILYEDEHMCGGAIINEFWVITTAHCLYDGIHPLYSVAVGDHMLWKKDPYEAIYKGRMIVFHYDYNKRYWDYDLALLKIQPDRHGRGIQFNDYVQPACLPEGTEDPTVGTPVTVAGWGQTEKYGQESETLKKTVLPVVTYKQCKKFDIRRVSPNMFCAGIFNGDTDLCSGDSGGPGFINTADGVVLVGIAAFGTGCALPNTVSAFMSIPKFRGWIDSKIREQSKGVEGLMPIRGHNVTG